MIFILFVLLFLVAVEQTLTFSTLKHPRTVSSFSLVHPTSRQQLVSSSFSRTVTPSLRSFATPPPRLVTTLLDSSSSNPEVFNLLEKKIGALKHLLKGGNSTTASEDIRESVLIYEGSDKEFLRSMIKGLQEEKTERQREKSERQRKDAALQEEKTALSRAAVGSKGTLRWTKI